jgi:cytochrome P450
MPPWMPVPGANRFKESLRSIDRVVYGLIEQRRRATTLGDDLLSTLLIARDAEGGQPMTDQQLRDEVVTMFLASYEPVVTTLAWTWVLLSRNPSVARRLQQEVRQVIGGRLPAFDDLRQLTYSRCVLQEALRLYPPVWLLIREAAEEDVVGGVRIPAGATTLGFTYGIHHDARIWSDPEAFDPARFSRESTAENRRFTYMPFGAGPHKCIGEHYAMMEAQLFLVILLQQYQVRLIPGQRIRPRATFTLRPGGPVLATLQPA